MQLPEVAILAGYVVVSAVLLALVLPTLGRIRENLDALRKLAKQNLKKQEDLEAKIGVLERAVPGLRLSIGKTEQLSRDVQNELGIVSGKVERIDKTLLAVQTKPKQMPNPQEGKRPRKQRHQEVTVPPLNPAQRADLVALHDVIRRQEKGGALEGKASLRNEVVEWFKPHKNVPFYAFQLGTEWYLCAQRDRALVSERLGHIFELVGSGKYYGDTLLAASYGAEPPPKELERLEHCKPRGVGRVETI